MFEGQISTQGLLRCVLGHCFLSYPALESLFQTSCLKTSVPLSTVWEMLILGVKINHPYEATCTKNEAFTSLVGTTV